VVECDVRGRTLLKRVVGKAKKFGGLTFNKQFKSRHFCLTTQNLFYAKAKHKPISWNLPVSEIRGVEKLREDSFKMKNVCTL
jgi:Ras GTPase-activating protein 3